MARSGSNTKELILKVSEQLVMERGFGSTSIDQILEKTGLTKGAFFYHFKSKADLALALIERYIKRDDDMLHESIAKVENLSRDPLQHMLIFLGLLIDDLDKMESPHPGCMIASFIYQFEEFSSLTKEAVANGFDEWHRVLDKKFKDILENHQPVIEVSAQSLVDNFLSAFEGGLVLAKMMNQPQAFTSQIRHFKNYIELLFGTVK